MVMWRNEAKMKWKWRRWNENNVDNIIEMKNEMIIMKNN